MEGNNNVLNLIDIVVRQTDYDNEKALEQLEKFEYDPIKVIRNIAIKISTPGISNGK